MAGQVHAVPLQVKRGAHRPVHVSCAGAGPWWPAQGGKRSALPLVLLLLLRLGLRRAQEQLEVGLGPRHGPARLACVGE